MNQPRQKSIIVTETSSNFEREKLVRPFGFKGGYLTELWQIASKMRSATGNEAVGLATQSVLYGDADLFAANSEAYGNSLMYVLTNRALQLIKQTPFANPVQLLETILPELMNQAKTVTGKNDININFIYNALVSVDNAAWLLYAAEHGVKSFAEMIPKPYRKTLSYRNNKIAYIYQVSYAMPVREIAEAAKQGYFVFKIKTGYPGTQEEMLAADKERLTQIHDALKDFRSSQTPGGKLLYTMDANGRYEKKATLLKYLEHAKAIGALEHILLYEEPFNEAHSEDVHDVPVKVAADESANDEQTTLQRIEQGYSVIVLKGIAKTLSLSLKIATIAAGHGIPCICSDLTVNPILVDWHKNLSAHLAPFPGLGMGLMETNGDVNYVNWPVMQGYHPAAGANWMQVKDGVFELGDGFYHQGGGIFEPSAHYRELFTKL